jgi:hypothetical protein
MRCDFADTDVPFDVALPEGPYATEAAREEVLALSKFGAHLRSSRAHLGSAIVLTAADEGMLSLLFALQCRLHALHRVLVSLSVVPCMYPSLQARNYVLEVSMDQQVEQSLSTRPCEHCGVDTYEANLTCHACQAHWEPCAVSGYPVPPGERVVPRGNTAARRDDWNAWVNKFHTDPMTGAPATPLY